MPYTIRYVCLSDHQPWRTLWQSYLEFYNQPELPEENTNLLWQRIHIDQHPFKCLVVESTVDNTLLGFAHFFAHPDTWRTLDVCYLEDLFVIGSARGKGVAKALISQIQDYCRTHDLSHLYWQTKADNAQARILYDKLTGGTNGFVTYRLGC